MRFLCSLLLLTAILPTAHATNPPTKLGSADSSIDCVSESRLTRLYLRDQDLTGTLLYAEIVTDKGQITFWEEANFEMNYDLDQRTLEFAIYDNDVQDGTIVDFEAHADSWIFRTDKPRGLDCSFDATLTISGWQSYKWREAMEVEMTCTLVYRI